MLNQLPPSGNHSYGSSFTALSRSHPLHQSPMPSSSNLPILSQASSTSSSGIPQLPLPYLTPTLQHGSRSTTSVQSTSPPTQPTPGDSSSLNSLALLPPLPLPQLSDNNSATLAQLPQNQLTLTPLNAPQTQPGEEDFPDDQIVERALLEDSFIEHGLLAVDKSVSILGEILNLSEGRDKLFKVFSAILKLAKYALNNWYVLSQLHLKFVYPLRPCICPFFSPLLCFQSYPICGLFPFPICLLGSPNLI